MDFPDWAPRDLADAAKLNTRVRDTHRELANPARLSVAGVSRVTGIPGDGTAVPLQWDTADWMGSWTSNNGQSYTVPISGFYYLTADFTALSPKDSPKTPALRLAAVNLTAAGDREWFRANNPTVVPGTYVTVSLRGVGFAEAGDRLTLRASTAPGGGEWEVSAGSRTSAQLNRLSAVLIAPAASR